MIQEIAPAKVNLSLHITGQRADGYHLLDSLVMFASVGDHLSFAPADALDLSVIGPEADAVPVESNSILNAAKLLNPNAGALMQLAKNLPVASGIGGGTADAAAALRGLAKLWGLEPVTPTAEAFHHVAQLGADVPVCLFSKTARMSGIGEDITFLPTLPSLHAVLVNPRAQVSTPAVFKAIATKNNAPMAAVPEQFATRSDFVTWLAQQRNDMQTAAIQIEPAIGNVLNVLEGSTACQLARMSGSGATCFGLYDTPEAAQKAAANIALHHPNWWVQPCMLGDARA